MSDYWVRIFIVTSCTILLIIGLENKHKERMREISFCEKIAEAKIDGTRFGYGGLTIQCP